VKLNPSLSSAGLEVNWSTSEEGVPWTECTPVLVVLLCVSYIDESEETLDIMLAMLFLRPPLERPVKRAKTLELVDGRLATEPE
jgi:hypothetical protein